jgi:hypothetical protein
MGIHSLVFLNILELYLFKYNLYLIWFTYVGHISTHVGELNYIKNARKLLILKGFFWVPFYYFLGARGRRAAIFDKLNFLILK